MKSGLEGRNNAIGSARSWARTPSLNEVRPRRPEQSTGTATRPVRHASVSMKSGLEGRNNVRAMTRARVMLPLSQ